MFHARAFLVLRNRIRCGEGIMESPERRENSVRFMSMPVSVALHQYIQKITRMLFVRIWADPNSSTMLVALFSPI